MTNYERINKAVYLLFQNPIGCFCYCTNKNRIIKLDETDYNQLSEINKIGKLQEDEHLTKRIQTLLDNNFLKPSVIEEMEHPMTKKFFLSFRI